MSLKVVPLISKSHDSATWSPKDALQEVLGLIEAGEINPESMMIHWWEETAEKTLQGSHRFVNLSKETCVSRLSICLHDAIEDWKI